MILVEAGASPAPVGRAFAGDWAYLGVSASRLFRWKRALGAASYTDLAPRLADAARALREPYLEWVAGLDERYADDADWWQTQVCEKNPLASPLYFQLCALWALRAMAGEKSLPSLVVCDGGALAEASRRTLRAAGCAVSLPAPIRGGRPAETVKRLARGLQFTGRAAAALARKKAPARRPGDRKPLALLVTYLHEDSLSPEGALRDRYFPGLRESLEAAGYQVSVLPKPLDTTLPRAELVRRMRKSPVAFIVPEDYLKAADYAAALRGSRRSRRLPSGAPPLAGLDASPLLAEERDRQARSLEGMQARLMRLLPSRLAAAGILPSLVVSWFENHKDDKALAQGVRAAWPKADHAGYLGLLPAPLYTTVLPTPAQVRAGALPRRLICCGSRQAEQLAARGALVSVGAALRYRYLWEDARPADDSRTALVVLPSRTWEAAELLAALAPVTRQDTGVERWLVKPHPDYTLDELRAALDDSWPQGLELLHGSLRDGLLQSGVVVSAGSGAAVEAACLGVPVALVGRMAGLDCESLGWFPDLAPVCRTTEELAARVRAALNLPHGARAALRERGLRLRRECFEPVTEASLRVFHEAPRRTAA